MNGAAQGGFAGGWGGAGISSWAALADVTNLPALIDSAQAQVRPGYAARAERFSRF